MITSYSKTNIGKKRNINQDYVYVNHSQIGLLDNLFIVADGMGGHRAGGFASRFAVNNLATLISSYNKSSEPKDILKDNIMEVNKLLFDKSNTDKELSGMGTTIVAATIKARTLYFAHVGDSRLYIVNTEIKQMTTDHSLVNEMVRLGQIRPEEAKNHPDRNVITRAVGIAPKVEVDIADRRIRNNDYVLMCTDGLTSMVENEDIFKTIVSARDPVEATVDLINMANNNGGKDNIGIIVIDPRDRRISNE